MCDAVVIKPADWPPLDKVPDTSPLLSRSRVVPSADTSTASPQVQKWMKELDGWNIPTLDVTTGDCAGSPARAAAGPARGWWTCGGWTAPTDITVCPTKYDWGVSFDDGPSPYSASPTCL
jgi:hypothetical protein